MSQWIRRGGIFKFDMGYDLCVPFPFFLFTFVLRVG